MGREPGVLVVIVDLFAGAGGWDVAARDLGLCPIGIETDAAACATRSAAGLRTVRADVTSIDPGTWPARVDGLIASPPCPAFSRAGDGRGVRALDGLCAYVRSCARSWRPWLIDGASPLLDVSDESDIDVDPGTDALIALSVEPLRWVDALRPTWVAMEQVPPALPLWHAYEHCLRAWGYRTWTGVLCAADYGVPQTRRRAIFMARRDRQPWPEGPTHSESGGGLFGLKRWVPMARALGWGDEPSWDWERADGRRCSVTSAAPARTVTGKADQGWAAPNRMRLRTGANTTVSGRPYDRSVDRPAPTVDTKAGRTWRLNTNRGTGPSESGRQQMAVDRAAPAATTRASGQWVWSRPSTTVVDSFEPTVITRPGHRDWVRGIPRQDAAGGVRVTLAELAALQGFAPGFPWQGNRTQIARQIGNAVPPALAAAVLAPLIDNQPARTHAPRLEETA
ncbi:MAG TPA: DNA cytosine methyltransferase [Mycobacteriales bacterium]